MLIRRPILERIFDGEIDLQFRRWTKPTVKAGGTLRTALGMLEIIELDIVAMHRLTAEDAHRAGYATLTALRDHMRQRNSGRVHRIRVRPGGPDPLVELRSSSDLSLDDVEAIGTRLARLDAASRVGPWTGRYLDLLADHPHVRAEDLAESIGLDKPTFKNNVRKLKALGLTISHSPGYELSPRGRAYRTETNRT